MGTLIDFTTAYTGGPTFYTGTGVSGLVPDIFPVAIGGRPYMLDMKSNRFGRAFEQRLRDSQDGANIPGESALNPQGLWRRGQVSWHKGSGQKYGDTAEGIDTRFSASKNVDPWTKGQLSLLKSTTQIVSSANTNLKMVVAGSRLYVADGTGAKHTSDPYATSVSFTTVTSPPGGDLNCITTDGYTVWAGFTAHGIHSTNTGTSAFSSYITGTDTFTSLAYVKGRLMAGAGASMYNFTASGGPGAALYTHPNGQFSWVGFASGQNHIYCAGFAGNVSLIYRTAVKADGTSLDIPTIAGELPFGEIVSSIYGYLSYIVIGTNRGVRLATSDDNGNLIIGPMLETPETVQCASGDGRFVWFGWTNFDSTSTGLGRLDLSQYNSVNEPAYASDIMVDVQGDVLSVANYDERRLFAVSGQGFYREHASVVAASGYVETGSWRWGIPDPKFATFVDFRTAPLTGSLSFSLNLDNGGYESLADFTAQGNTELTLTGPETPFGEGAFKISFTRSSTDTTVGPTLTRWQVRAFPAPKRSELFSVPILLHQRLNRGNREYYFDVENELAFLRDFIKDTRITTYQEGEETFTVIIENIEWTPIDSGSKSWMFDGTAVVTLRSLTA